MFDPFTHLLTNLAPAPCVHGSPVTSSLGFQIGVAVGGAVLVLALVAVVVVSDVM